LTNLNFAQNKNMQFETGTGSLKQDRFCLKHGRQYSLQNKQMDQRGQFATQSVRFATFPSFYYYFLGHLVPTGCGEHYSAEDSPCTPGLAAQTG
jgi:hypothetical protein